MLLTNGKLNKLNNTKKHKIVSNIKWNFGYSKDNNRDIQVDNDGT